MTELEKIQRVKAISIELATMFPDQILELGVYRTGDWTFSHHGLKRYDEAQAWFRALGVQKQDKSVWPARGYMHEYTALTGKWENGTLKAYPDELPPSCRKVVKVERVPKTQTVETGEFIEIKREVIECGEPESAAELQPQSV